MSLTLEHYCLPVESLKATPPQPPLAEINRPATTAPIKTYETAKPRRQRRIITRELQNRYPVIFLRPDPLAQFLDEPAQSTLPCLLTRLLLTIFDTVDLADYLGVPAQMIDVLALSPRVWPNQLYSELLALSQQYHLVDDTLSEWQLQCYLERTLREHRRSGRLSQLSHHPRALRFPQPTHSHHNPR